MSVELIAGLDEVGMGCLAGPVVVAVVAFPANRTRIAGVTDSKKLSRRQLTTLAPIINKECAWCGYGFASVKSIDELGMPGAWQLAAEMALIDAPRFEKLIVDGVVSVKSYEQVQETIPKADTLHWQVSAASIIAKVLRDTEMADLAEAYPGYGWAKNVGYGTKHHRDAILKLGPTPLHRAKYIRNVLNPKPKKEKVPSRF